MGTTVNGIYLPSAGESGWDSEVNDNFRRLGDVGHNVKAYGAVGDGSTNDSAAFTSVVNAAGIGGRIFVPPGTYRVSDVVLKHGQVLTGVGWGTVLKANGTSQVLGISTDVGGILNCRIRDMQIDGNSLASAGIQIGGGLIAGGLNTQGHQFMGVNFQNCSVGVHVGSGDAQCDKNQYISCQFNGCTIGMHIDSLNAHEQTLVGTTFNSVGEGIRLSGGSFNWTGGQVQTASTCGVKIDSARGYSEHVHMTDVQMESETISIIGTAGWPLEGVHLQGCIFQGATATVNMGVASGILFASNTKFTNGNINCTGNSCTFVDIFCVYNGGAIWNNTGVGSNRYKLDYTTGWQGSDAAAAVSFKVGQVLYLNGAGGSARVYSPNDASGDFIYDRSGTEAVRLGNGYQRNKIAGHYEEFLENGTTDPAAGGVNTGRLYVKDNGAGKTQLCVRFNTGAVQVIATEP